MSKPAGCASEVGRALAVARAGDADRGYHVTWRMIERALLAIGDEPSAESIAEVDNAEAALRALVGAPQVWNPLRPVPVKQPAATPTHPQVTADVPALRAQLAEWRPHWASVRACLVGAPQHAEDLGDALAVSSLLDTQCFDEVDKLRVPGPTGPTAPEIERAWVSLDRAVIHLRHEANAYGHDQGRSAILDIEDWTAALAGAAGLPSERARAVALRALAPVPQQPGMRELRIPTDETRMRIAPRDHVLALRIGSSILEATAADRIVVRPDLALLAGAVDVFPVSPGAAWGADDKSGVRGREIVVGETEPSGELREPTRKIATDENVIAALGDGDQRVVIASSGWEAKQVVSVHRSVDAGRTWRVVTKIAGAPKFDITSNGNTDLVWVDNKSMRWLHVTPTFQNAKPVSIPLPTGSVRSVCGAGARLWYIVGDQPTVHWFEGRRRGSAMLPADERDALWDPTLATCSADAALIVSRTHATRCSSACDPMFRAAESGENASVVDLLSNGVVTARQADSVVGVWRNWKDARFARLSEGEVLAGIVAWGDVPWLLTVGTNGARFSPAP